CVAHHSSAHALCLRRGFVLTLSEAPLRALARPQEGCPTLSGAVPNTESECVGQRFRIARRRAPRRVRPASCQRSPSRSATEVGFPSRSLLRLPAAQLSSCDL